MNSGFVGVNAKIEQVNDKIGQVSEKIEDRFDEFGRMVKNEFDTVYARFAHMDERFDGVDLELAMINRRLQRAVYETEFEALGVRVTALERHTGLGRHKK